MKFTLRLVGDWAVILIDDTTHFAIRRSLVYSIQAWETVETPRLWCIEYRTRDGDVLVEYDTVEKWKAHLALVPNVLSKSAE